ncbi:SRPBCC family protein [Aquihabitans daechungensis]|uniref:SRPBCC family protein n=1 Tax=Aquihabitans daechungensis TaxID=1052257 RepID=UPI003BA02459
MQDSVTVHMDATPEQVWALVSDVTRIGEFSPETFEAEWLDGATGPEVGARFRGHVKRNEKGPTYWTTCKVTVCEPLEEFTFAVIQGDNEVNTWGYKLAAADGGTDVTEFFHLAEALPLKIYWFLAGWARGKTNRNGMRRTLEAMKAVVEAE